MIENFKGTKVTLTKPPTKKDNNRETIIETSINTFITMSILITVLFGNVAFAGDEWFGCIESKIREECEECFKSKSPADTMKWLEELTVKYEKRN